MKSALRSQFRPSAVVAWLDGVDPRAHRRAKGLRLVTAFGIAALLGATPAIAGHFPRPEVLTPLACGIALWSSVSEGRVTRQDSARDLVLPLLPKPG